MIPTSQQAPTIEPGESRSFSDATVAERRLTRRIQTCPSLAMTALGSPRSHKCVAIDISETGLFVQLPVEHQPAVGQRFELTFTDESPSAELPNLAGLTCYATVVRTKRCVTGPETTVGAGLRFDHPLYL